MVNHPAREAVGVFRDFETLRAAADELLTSGFERADLSLLADHRTILRKRGRLYASMREAGDDLEVPFRPYVAGDSRVEIEAFAVGISVYAGAMTGGIAGAAAGFGIWPLVGAVALAGAAGGLIGGAIAYLLESRNARVIREQLADGGLLLWVRAADPTHEQHALEILTRHAADDVHVHELPHRTERGVHGVSRELSWLYKPLFRIFAR